MTMRALFVPFTVALSVSMSAMQPLAAAEVGVTAAVNPQALGTPPVGSPRTLSLGDGIVFQERIDTSGDGLVQVLFTDGSTITVGPGASLTIDEYIYDPAAGTGRLAVSFGRGALRFIGGRLSKTGDNVEINTPVGTVGIRGGMGDLAIDDARAIMALLFGNQLTLDDLAGRRHRVFERGYTLEFNRLVPIAEAVNIRRLLASDTAFFQRQLAGRPGTTGGAREQPTDETVEESGIAEVNSALPLVELTPPPPPDTVSTTSPAEVESSLVGISDATSDTARERIRQQDVIDRYEIDFGLNVEMGGIDR
jgi:trimeric autotransporter adhesin